MILTCPACSTRYQVAEDQFPAAGRTVRCNKCGHQWFQKAPDPDPDPGLFVEPETKEEDPAPLPETDSSPEPAPAPEAAAAPAAPPAPEPPAAEEQDPVPGAFAPLRPADPPQPGKPALLTAVAGLGWAALVAAVLAISWGAYHYRRAVMESWPQSASLYAALGLKADQALAFADCRFRETVENGRPVLEITGRIVNRTDKTVAVPKIRAVLSDDAYRSLFGWTFAPDGLTVEPGQSTRFAYRLSSPPQAARHLDLHFVPAGE
jgi:predicted Zn finger-like uncharacterized protein